MIGVFGGKTIAAMMQKTAELERQVESLSARLVSTSDRLAAVSSQLASVIEQSEAQATGMADLERRGEALASFVADQAAAIVRLGERGERQLELDRQLRADMIRLERQATIDVSELRQTSLALAERLVTTNGIPAHELRQRSKFE